MEDWQWIVVSLGTIMLGVGFLAVLWRRARQHKQILVNRVNRLGDHLTEQSTARGAEEIQTSPSSISQQIFQVLRESHNLDWAEASSVLSSISPANEADVALSDRLTELIDKLKNGSDSEAQDYASLAVIYVRSHLSEAVRVEDMAREFRISSSKLNFWLKRSLECSAQELITVIKMQRAKEFLRTSGLLVKEVAYRLGYENPYYFSTRFKLFFGLSPKHFRQHYSRRSRKLSLEKPARYDSQSKIAQRDQIALRDNRGQNQNLFQTLPMGTKVDRFVIVNQLGRGGMGVVYKAYDPKLNRGVALKLIRSDLANSQELHDRLLREAQALAKLSHPNVLDIYDVGTFDGHVFITMALVEGLTLTQWLSAEKRSVEEVLEVMIAAGRGLSAAHKAGLVHRDFKPSNVIVGDDGRVCVLDFGLARTTSTQDVINDNEVHATKDSLSSGPMEISAHGNDDLLLSPLTQGKTIVGTPLYMAPEQYLGKSVDARSDQFGFCVVLYEAVYGKRPYASNTLKTHMTEIVQDHVRQPPSDKKVPSWLWKFIRKGLRADPRDRYRSLDVLLEQLKKNPNEAFLRKRQGRRRIVFAVIFLFSATALPAIFWYGFRYRTYQLCKDAQGEFDGAWDNFTKTQVRKSFLATKKSYAEETWLRTEQLIDSYLAGWLNMRRGFCKDKILRSTLSERTFDLGINCLRDRKRDLISLVQLFARADNRVLDSAVQASSLLAGVSSCAENRLLQKPHPAPPTARAKTKVSIIREQLAHIRALKNTGKYEEGLEKIKKLNEQALAVGYLPAQAEVLFIYAQLLCRRGDYRQAETFLYKAAKTGSRGTDVLLTARIMASIAWVVGYRQGRYEEGLSFIRAGFYMLEMTGGDDVTQAKLLNHQGILVNLIGDPDRALQLHFQSLRIYRKVYGPHHRRIATLFNNIGAVYHSLGESQQALDYYHKSLEILKELLGPAHPQIGSSWYNIGTEMEALGQLDIAEEYYRKAETVMKEGLGPEHPKVSFILIGIGEVQSKKGDYPAAHQSYLQSRSITEKTHGTKHPLLAWSLSGIGSALAEQGLREEGLVPLERVISLCSEVTCQPEPFARAQFRLARILSTTKRDDDRAIALAEQARQQFNRLPERFGKRVKEIDRWLHKQRARIEL